MQGWGRFIHGLTVAVLGLLIAACSTVSDVKNYASPIPPGKGILLLSVDTDTVIKNLELRNIQSGTDDTAAQQLEKGHSVRALLAPAGDYELDRLDLPDILGIWNGDPATYANWISLDQSDRHYRFSVRPGKINYGGDLVIRSNAAQSIQVEGYDNRLGIYPGQGDSYRIQLIDRLTLLLEDLDAGLKSFVAKDGIVYTGPGTDIYPEPYKPLPENLPIPGTGKKPLVEEASVLPVADFFLRPAYSDPMLSPDGKLVVAVSHPNEIFSALTITDLATHHASPALQVTGPNENFDQLQWISNDTIIFTLHADRDDAVLMALRWAPDDEVGHAEMKQWSGKYFVLNTALHDGKQIAFTARQDSGPQPRVCELTADLVPGPEILKFGSCGEEVDPDMMSAGTDKEGRLQYLTVWSDDGKLHFKRRAPGTIGWQEYKQIDPVTQTFRVISSYSDGTLGVLSDLGRDTTALEKYDPMSDKVVKTIFGRDDADVDKVHFDPASRQFLYLTWFSGPEPRFEMLSDSARAVMRGLQGEFRDEQVVPWAISKDDDTAIVYAFSDKDPGGFYGYDLKTGQTQPLGSAMPWLDQTALSPVQAGTVKTQDGLTLSYLLTLPSTKAKSYPLVVIPHGGPIGVFDARTFDPEVQLLASRGYATLKVNYRGSGGEGFKFEQAGEKQWGRKIEDDISEAVHTVLRTAPIDTDRVCIFGSSYGGYSALVSAARDPKLYRCAASLDGVMDLTLLYDTTDIQQDAPTRAAMAKIIGDPTTDAEKLRAVSPVYLADKIQCPVLIAQGGKDTRVDMEQAFRMKTTLERLHKPVVYISYPTQEHGFDNPVDETDFYTQLLAFLDANIGAPMTGNGATK